VFALCRASRADYFAFSTKRARVRLRDGEASLSSLRVRPTCWCLRIESKAFLFFRTMPLFEYVRQSLLVNPGGIFEAHPESLIRV